jgi:hypothetical protein
VIGSLLLPVYSRLSGALRVSLIVPGLSLLLVAVVSVHMGDGGSLTGLASAVAGQWPVVVGRSVAVQAVAVVVVLSGCVAVSAGVEWAGQVAVHRVLGAERAPRIVRELRGRRFDRYNNRFRIDPPSSYRPQSLTPVGEATRLLALRVHSQYHLNVAAAWPRVVLVADDRLTAAVAAAQAQYRTSLGVIAWGVLVLPLGWFWPPAIAVGASAMVAGYSACCRCARETVLLIESGIDVNQAALAAAVGIALPNGRIERTEGQRINNILTKRAHREQT